MKLSLVRHRSRQFPASAFRIYHQAKKGESIKPVNLLRPRFTFKSEAAWIWMFLVGPLVLGLALAFIFWLLERVFEF